MNSTHNLCAQQKQKQQSSSTYWLVIHRLVSLADCFSIQLRAEEDEIQIRREEEKGKRRDDVGWR